MVNVVIVPALNTDGDRPMQSLPNSAALPSALDYLVRALEILDETTEIVIAAKVSDVVDLLNARLPQPGS